VQEKVHALAIQSCEFITESEGEGSKARIRAACELIRQGRIPADCQVLWPQGYQKKDPGRPVVLGQEGLGYNMARYATMQPEMSEMHNMIHPMSWGTKGDVLACYQMVRDLGYKTAHLYFVSDPVHLMRVRLVWFFTHPRGWTADFFPAHAHTMTTFERWVREPVAVLVYTLTLLPRFLFGIRG
jgi:hypothetical protein